MTVFLKKYAEYIITLLVLVILILVILLISGIGLSKIDNEMNSLSKPGTALKEPKGGATNFHPKM